MKLNFIYHVKCFTRKATKKLSLKEHRNLDENNPRLKMIMIFQKQNPSSQIVELHLHVVSRRKLEPMKL